MKSFKTELKWGVIFTVAGLVWMVLERAVGLHDELIAYHAIYTNLFAIPAIVIYVLALIDKKKNFYNGEMTYSQGFMSGLLITLFVTILSPLSQYITSTYITPYYFNNVIEYTIRENQMTREDAEAYFNMKNYIIQSVIAAPVMGILTSAIVALFVRSKKSIQHNPS